MLKRDLKDVTESVFGKELGLTSVEKVKYRIPTTEGVTRATILIALTSQEEAKKVCEEGAVWRAQMLNCEPYCPALQATQFYKCWGWGHAQRFCKKSASVPAMWHSGPWGGREGRRGSVPNPWQHSAFKMTRLG